MTIQFASGAARQANFLSGSSKTWRTVYQSCGRQTVANCIPSPTNSHVFSTASQACYSIASSTTSICTFTQTELTGMRRSLRTVQLRDTETYQPLHHWLFPREQDDQTLYSVLFSQDGRYLACGDESRKITLDDPKHRSPACNICSRCHLALTLVLSLFKLHSSCSLYYRTGSMLRNHFAQAGLTTSIHMLTFGNSCFVTPWNYI
jgi:hypothetical protein